MPIAELKINGSTLWNLELCNSTPSVLDRAGYNGKDAEEATRIFDEVENHSHDVFNTISRLAAAENNGVYLRPACSGEILKELQIAAHRSIGESFPGAVISLFALSDGCQINNAYFYKAQNLLDALNRQCGGMFVPGDDETAYLMFDSEDRRFQIILEGATDEKFKSFDTFEELLLRVMKEQAVI